MTIMIKDLNATITMDRAEAAALVGGYQLPRWARQAWMSNKKLVTDTYSARRMKNNNVFFPAPDSDPITGWGPLGPYV